MANIRVIRQRIKGIKNISKITKAMEMIAASKMRKAQERGLAGRPYCQKITQVIASLAALSLVGESAHPLLDRRKVKKIAIVHIAPDRGLCGGLLANLNRQAGSFIIEQKIPASIVTVGRKSFDFMRRSRRDIKAEFNNMGDNPGYLDTLPISHIIIDDFINGEVDEVYISFTQFINTMNQKAVIEKILPVEPAQVEKGQNLEYIYEPNSQKVLNNLLPRFVEMRIYHALLEAIASEHSARMVAMRSATDNANELTDDLTLVYNKARQESITTELLDIIGGASALA